MQYKKIVFQLVVCTPLLLMCCGNFFSRDDHFTAEYTHITHEELKANDWILFNYSQHGPGGSSEDRDYLATDSLEVLRFLNDTLIRVIRDTPNIVLREITRYSFYQGTSSSSVTLSKSLSPSPYSGSVYNNLGIDASKLNDSLKMSGFNSPMSYSAKYVKKRK